MAWYRLSATVLAVLASSATAGEPRSVVLDVPSMNCSLCPVSVRKALERVSGVIEARAELATKTATATFDPDQVTPEALVQAVSRAGYPATLRQK